MSKGAEATARWRAKRKSAGLDQLNLVVPQAFHAGFRELVASLYDHLPQVEADPPIEFVLCYRNKRGQLRHWRG